MSRRNAPTLTEELALGPYKPQYDPVDPMLPQFVVPSGIQEQEAIEKVDRRVAGKGPANTQAAALTNGDIPRPLTKAEALVVIARKNDLRKQIAVTRGRIAGMRGRIDEMTKSEDGSELSFTVDISKKGAVRRALRKAFGIKTNSLTYEMYITALELRNKIEKEEKDEYLASNRKENKDK